MGTGQLEVGSSRNYAVDLLRIISMFMIIVLHGNAHGGLLSLTEGMNVYSVTIHFFESLSIVSVNVFVLISGYYLSAKRDTKLSRTVKLIFATWFYSWLWLIICLVLGDEIGKATLIKNLAPISYYTYWFIPIYIGMVVFSPFLNICINTMTKKQHGILVLFLLFCFSIWPTIVPYSNPFGFAIGGFCLEWFIVLYFIAAYIQRYGLFNFKSSYWLIGYLSLSVIILIIWITLSELLGIRDFTDEWKGSHHFYFFKYNSIFVLLASICLFRLFLNLKITNDKVCKIIKFAAPLMIGVYLISDNKLGREYVWQGLTSISEVNPGTLLYVAVYFVLLFLICIIIEWLRSKLFKLLENSKGYRNLLSIIDTFPSHIFDRIMKVGNSNHKN